MDGVKVEVVWSYKYLGLQLEEKLDWSQNTDLHYGEVQSRLFFLRSWHHLPTAGGSVGLWCQCPLLWCVVLVGEQLQEAEQLQTDQEA